LNTGQFLTQVFTCTCEISYGRGNTEPQSPFCSTSSYTTPCTLYDWYLFEIRNSQNYLFQKDTNYTAYMEYWSSTGARGAKRTLRLRLQNTALIFIVG